MKNRKKQERKKERAREERQKLDTVRKEAAEVDRARREKNREINRRLHGQGKLLEEQDLLADRVQERPAQLTQFRALSGATDFRQQMIAFGVRDELALSLTDRVVGHNPEAPLTKKLQQESPIIAEARGRHPETYKLIAEASAHELASVDSGQLRGKNATDQLRALAKEESYQRFAKATTGIWRIQEEWVAGGENRLLPLPNGDQRAPFVEMPPELDSRLRSEEPASLAEGMAMLKMVVRSMTENCTTRFCESPEGIRLNQEITGMRKMMGTDRDLTQTMSGGLATAIKFMMNTMVIGLHKLVRRHGSTGVTPEVWLRTIKANRSYIALLASQMNLNTLNRFEDLVIAPRDEVLFQTLQSRGMLRMDTGEEENDEANYRFYSLFNERKFRFVDDSEILDIDPEQFTQNDRKTLLSRSAYTHGCPAMDVGVVLKMYDWLAAVLERYAMPFTGQFADEIAHQMAA